MNHNNARIVIKHPDELQLSESTRALNPQWREMVESGQSGQPPAKPPKAPPDKYFGRQRPEPEPRRVDIYVEQPERESREVTIHHHHTSWPRLIGNFWLILLIIAIAFAAGLVFAVWAGPWAFGIDSLRSAAPLDRGLPNYYYLV